MENQEDKNYTKTIGGNSQSSASDGNKIVIHTMPKRYMVNAPAANSAKSTGFLILISGFIFLIAALLVLYFFVLKKPAQIEITKENPNTQNNEEVATTAPKVEDIKEPEIETEPLTDELIGTTSEDNADATTTPTNESTVDFKKFPIGNDSDKDNLTDMEEYLLGSSPNSQDTDGDGYPDALEVFNLYDPSTKGRIADSLSIEELINEDYNFLMLVPSAWVIEKVSDNDSLIVSLGKSQFIQIISQNKAENQSLDEWYMELFDVDEVLDAQKFKKGNWNGIINNNGLTYYLEHPNKNHIITLNYEIGDDHTLYFKNVFDMMLQSIAIKN